MIIAFSSLPIMLFSIFGGHLIDLIGTKSSLLIFGSIRVISHIICFEGLRTHNFYTLLIGRLIFGISDEIVDIINIIVLTQWFMETDLTFSYSIVLSVNRFGSLINS